MSRSISVMQAEVARRLQVHSGTKSHLQYINQYSLLFQTDETQDMIGRLSHLCRDTWFAQGNLLAVYHANHPLAGKSA